MKRSTTYPSESPHALVALFVFDHPDMAQPIYLTNAASDLLVNGDLHVALPIALQLAAIGEDSPPAGRITVDAVSRVLIRELRTLDTPMTCEARVVREADPTDIEMGPFDFEVRNVKWSVTQITADLVYDSVLGIGVPGHLFGPATSPGLYR